MNNKLVRKINFIVSRYIVYSVLISGQDHIAHAFRELRVMQCNAISESLINMSSDNFRVLTNALTRP
jgi:hypothetical protein